MPTIDGKCKVDNIVYKAMLTTTDDGNTKEYIGMTFKSQRLIDLQAI